MDTKKIVEEIIENKAEDGGIQQVHWVRSFRQIILCSLKQRN